MVEKIYDLRNSPSPCQWTLNTDQACPHINRPISRRKLIFDTILQAAVDTPMVRINRITKTEGIQCQILAKCEYLNPGGSVKDRIGVRMVQDAQSQGRIRAGETILVEPTSGNTGIGLAMTAAVKGYELIVTMPQKMSLQKSSALRALGAKIVRTPTEALFSDAESHLGVAEKFEREMDNVVILDQYSNPANPLVHYDQTAQEIIQQCQGKLDYIVISAGTGGTLSGISRKIKEKMPHVKVIGVDPLGSIIHDPENAKAGLYKVQGTGYDFLPRVCDTQMVDQWFVSDDIGSFRYARRLIQQQGLLVGGSSGSVMQAAIQIGKTLPPDVRMVILLPDSVRNYMTKFIQDSWLLQNQFIEPSTAENNPLTGKFVRDLEILPSVRVNKETTAQFALGTLKQNTLSVVPVVENNKVKGVVLLNQLFRLLATKKIQKQAPCSTFMEKTFKLANKETPLLSLDAMFQSSDFVVFEDENEISVLTAENLLKFSESQGQQSYKWRLQKWVKEFSQAIS